MRPPQHGHGVGEGVSVASASDGWRRRWRGFEQAAREGDIVGARAIGEEAVMANAVKAVGQNVEQEAADEFIAVERHEAVAVLTFAPIILPFEGDAPASKATSRLLAMATRWV